tara:strand:- start:419 stop:550 length:132 start_codon:yes stop_codon:yes gene_type:complete
VVVGLAAAEEVVVAVDPEVVAEEEGEAAGRGSGPGRPPTARAR